MTTSSSHTTPSLTLRLVFRYEYKHGCSLRDSGPDQSLTIKRPHGTTAQRSQKIAKIVSRHLGLTKDKGWSVEFGRVSRNPRIPVFFNGQERVFANYK